VAVATGFEPLVLDADLNTLVSAEECQGARRAGADVGPEEAPVYEALETTLKSCNSCCGENSSGRS